MACIRCAAPTPGSTCSTIQQRRHKELQQQKAKAKAKAKKKKKKNGNKQGGRAVLATMESLQRLPAPRISFQPPPLGMYVQWQEVGFVRTLGPNMRRREQHPLRRQGCPHRPLQRRLTLHHSILSVALNHLELLWHLAVCCSKVCSILLIVPDGPNYFGISKCN